MCYDVKSGTQALLKYAKHRGDDPAYIKKLEQELELWTKTSQVYYQISGFAHPLLLVFTNHQAWQPQYFKWGLIPSWIKTKKQALQIANQTLNARAESIFEKPAFKQSALEKRCLIYIDAFYEHYHLQGKTFPYHIEMRNHSPLAIAGLWDEWLDIETGEVLRTCSIITTSANNLMKKIHNNPKLNEARMPVILPKHMQNRWLAENDQKTLDSLLIPFDENLLQSHTVKKLKGKEAVGNTIEATLPYQYPELDALIQGSLF